MSSGISDGVVIGNLGEGSFSRVDGSKGVNGAEEMEVIRLDSFLRNLGVWKPDLV